MRKGVAYRKTQTVNWDPVDHTVLANEQVIEGRGWRSGAIVEKREIPGYYLGITQYAEELLKDLDQLQGWPEQVRRMQEHWIGKSYGVNLASRTNSTAKERTSCLHNTSLTRSWASRSLPLLPSIRLRSVWQKTNPNSRPSSTNAAKAPFPKPIWPRWRRKVFQTGFCVKHPLTGADVPVWIGNYVLMTYGEGAVMGVPAHDERAFRFALNMAWPDQQVIR